MGLCRRTGQTQAFQAAQASTMAPLELLEMDRERPGSGSLEEPGATPRSTPSQHCPPLEPGLGKSHEDFPGSPGLHQLLTGLHMVLVSVDFLPHGQWTTRILDVSIFPRNVWREERPAQCQVLSEDWKRSPQVSSSVNLGIWLRCPLSAQARNLQKPEAQAPRQRPGD